MIARHFFFLLALMILSSCKTDKKETDPSSVFFENESLVQTEGEGCERPERQCTVISMDFPIATGPEEVSKKINNTLEEYIIEIVTSAEDTTTGSLKELADNFISDYLNTTENFPEEPTWEAYITGRVNFKSESLISIRILSEIFRGGAHGYRALSFLNFNPETGELYSHEDLFTSEFKDHAEKIFRNEQELPPGDNINSTGFWFDNDTFQLPTNIGFEEENVVLVYNAYEVAPYSAGDFYLEIPKEEVESYLKVK